MGGGQHVRLEERRAAAREKGAVVNVNLQKDEGVGMLGNPKSRADEIQWRKEALNRDEEVRGQQHEKVGQRRRRCCEIVMLRGGRGFRERGSVGRGSSEGGSVGMN